VARNDETTRNDEMTAPAHLLTDEALARFVRTGYLTVQTGLPRAFHEDVRRRLQEIYESEGNWGNNILPRVPQLQQVVDDPAVRGALSSILGPSFVAHPHRHGHLNLPGSAGQRLHKDTLDFSGDRQPPHHRPRWAIAFYYPQDVTADMGPTGIAPGTQFFVDQPDARLYPETTALGPAGTVTIVHFDIWHRGTSNLSDRPRFMVKFEFGRMDDPVADGEGAAGAAWPEGGGTALSPLSPLWSYVYGWLRGRPPGPPGYGATGDAGESCPASARDLRAEDESLRLRAAYTLGESGAAAVPALTDALRDGPEPLRRYAGYGLSAAGAPAVEALSQLTRSPDVEVRRAAVDSLSDMGRPAAPAVGALAAALGDASPAVRRQAAEALGTIGAPGAGATEALSGALRDGEPYVRFNAALALARIGPGASGAVPALVEALGDPDRYVRGWAALALRRIGTPQATEALLEHLMTARWCPLTTTQSRY
jgi:HEAT repeat protein